MRSLIIIEVEHDETTDDVETIVRNVLDENNFVRTYYPNFAKVTDWTVKVDLPECFKLA